MSVEIARRPRSGLDWVEKRIAPTRIAASVNPRAANFAGTCPLCAYPEDARYSPCSAFGSAALVAQMVQRRSCWSRLQPQYKRV